jgi:hypothetical protein
MSGEVKINRITSMSEIDSARRKARGMIRRALIALGLVTAGVLLPVSPAQAALYCGRVAQCTFHYYSEPAKVHLVGEVTFLCGGGISQWGTSTAYYTENETPC